MKYLLYIGLVGIGIAGGWILKPDVYQVKTETITIKSEPEIVKVCEASADDLRDRTPEKVIIYKNVCKSKPIEIAQPAILENKVDVVEYVAKEKPVKKEEKNNRLNLLVGAGPNGFKGSISGNSVDVDETRSAVLGVQYERKISEDINVNVLLQDNKTYSIGIGSDF